MTDGDGGYYSCNALSHVGVGEFRRTGEVNLVACASINYLNHYCLGNYLGLDDGIPYERLTRVLNTMSDPRFTPYPLPLTIHAYTELVHYEPENRHRPYDALHEVFNVLDYYRYALTDIDHHSR